MYLIHELVKDVMDILTIVLANSLLQRGKYYSITPFCYDIFHDYLRLLQRNEEKKWI